MSYFPESQLCHRNFRTPYTFLAGSYKNAIMTTQCVESWSAALWRRQFTKSATSKHFFKLLFSKLLPTSHLSSVTSSKLKKSFQHTHDMTQIEGGHVDDRVGAARGPDSVNRRVSGPGTEPGSVPGLARLKWAICKRGL